MAKDQNALNAQNDVSHRIAQSANNKKTSGQNVVTVLNRMLPIIHNVNQHIQE